MSEWKKIKLSEIASVNELSVGKNFQFKSIEYIDTSSVTENVFDLPQVLNLKDAPSRAKRLVKSGDTIISTVRPIQKHFGFISDCKPNTVLSTGFAVVSPKKVDPRFLYYFLTQDETTQYLNTIAEGGTTTFPAFRADELNDLEILLPDSIDTQKAIAEILSSLDDKIELNNQINQNLEALAQALFKQWFVDFEFPNENGEPYKSSGGEMINSELGEIPEGWGVKSLDEIAEYLNGIALQKFRPINETDPFLPVIKIRELRQGYADGEEKASNEIDKKYIILDGDILFSWSGSLLVDFWTGGRGALNQHLFKVTSKTYPKWFIFLWTKFHLLEFQKIAESKATTMGHIQRKHLSDAKVLVPSYSLLKKFTETFECIIEELISSRLESRKLMNLRDTLLPKLISGELEINESLLEPTF